MIDQAVPSADTQGVAAALRRDLARGDAAAASALPVLRYLIAAEDNALLGEEVLARVRGMLSDLAAQLLDALIGEADRRAHAPDEIAVLTRAFLDDAVLLGHVHALALEWRLTETLHQRLSLDPVVSPFVQAHLSADGAGAGAMARGFVAAQARWTQAQRRMALPLDELPDAVLDAVLAILRRLVGAEPSLTERAEAVETTARARHAASTDRLALAARLTAASEDPMLLRIEEAGVALFLSALALRSAQPREAAVLALQPGQRARLALAMTAAGAPASTVARQVLALHGETADCTGWATLEPTLAATILAGQETRA